LQGSSSIAQLNNLVSLCTLPCVTFGATAGNVGLDDYTAKGSSLGWTYYGDSNDLYANDLNVIPEGGLLSLLAVGLAWLFWRH